MFRLVWLHLRYFLSKNNIIVLCLVFSVYCVLSIIQSKFYVNFNEQVLYYNYYQSEYTYIMTVAYKIIMILFSCYLFSLIKSNSYFVLVKTSKFKFYFTKVLSNCLIIINIFIMMLLIYISSALLTKWYRFDYHIMIDYFKIMLQAIVFGLISNNLCYLLKTNFAFIFVFFLYIILENVLENSIFFQFMNAFLPVFISSDFIHINVILLYFLYFFTGYFQFKRCEIY